MKLTFRRWPGRERRSGQSAFTMVEIALSLAIIGFALVAIIGILPYGMSVQKENREDTIINQDATYWLESLRSGGRGAALLRDLPFYVDAITNYSRTFDANGNPVGTPVVAGYTRVNGANGLKLDTGEIIIGLLSTPKYEPLAKSRGGYRSNYVVAYVRALNGSSADKFPQQNPEVLGNAFGYKLISEVLPRSFVPTMPMTQLPTAESRIESNMLHNLYDVRLTFRWPLMLNGNVGQGRQSYRAVLGGGQRAEPVADPKAQLNLYYFEPQSYTYSP